MAVFEQVDGLPTIEQLAADIGVSTSAAEEMLTLVMYVGEPNTSERWLLLNEIVSRIARGERWEDFHTQLLLDSLPKIVHRMIRATML